MATGANVKIGVSGVAQFKQGINEANQAVKTFDAQLALCEKQFKATGDQESYLAMKSELLKGKLNAQKTTVEQIEKALDSMQKNGVERSSAAYQNLYRQLLQAKGGMIETKSEADKLGKSEDSTGKKADKLSEKLQGIGKGVGWDNVAEGISNITSKLESGARAAINFGRKIAQSALGATGFADDILHEAQKYGTDAETIQRMKNVSEFIETDLDTIMNARSRLAKNKDSLPELLGFSADGMSVEDAFWKAGEAIMAMTDEFEKEEAAQKVFGKGWKDLIPIFTAGQEEYNRALENTDVLTNEQVEQLGKADDAIKQIQQQIELMKNQFWAENADKIIELGNWIVKNKDGLVTALGAIAAGFAALKLGEVVANLMQIVSGFNLLAGGGAAGAAGAAGASGAGAAGATTAAGLGWAGWAGLAGAVGIGAGFAAAANARNNHAETVRGTNEYLAAQGAGNEILLANYLKAMQAQSALTWTESEADIAAITARVQETYQKLQEAEGGAEALQAYSDWRQEHSYGNDYWELPDTLAQAVQELTGGTDKQAQSNSEMAQAAQGLQGLPAQIANAMSSALSGIGITIDGQMLLGYVNNGLATQVNP